MPPIQEKEILRYAGCKEAQEEFLSQMREGLKELEGKLEYKVCWAEFPVVHEKTGVDLTFARVSSQGLMKNLEGCERIILFLATIGLGIDRLITRYSRISPVKALWFQAIGAERIESLCDLFCAEAAEKCRLEGKETRPRFSPGYGDLPLSLQKDIFRVLEGEKMGVFLNESLLMTPSKSVTAIVGIGKERKIQMEKGCAVCQKKDCAYKR